MTRVWQVEAETVVLDDRYLKLSTQQVRLPNGARIDDFHVIESPDWAATIAITDDGQLVLVEQYRHAHGGLSVELPAGVIEAGEAPLEAAARELTEETGYVASGVRPLWTIRPEPARHRQWAHFGIAHGVRKAGAARPEETEDLRVVLWPVSDLQRLLETMVHGLHVAALLLASQSGLLIAEPSRDTDGLP